MENTAEEGCIGVCVCVLEGTGAGSDLYLVSGESGCQFLRPLMSSKSETWGPASTLGEKKPIRKVSFTCCDFISVCGNKSSIYCLVNQANYHPPVVFDMIVCH